MPDGSRYISRRCVELGRRKGIRKKNAGKAEYEGDKEEYNE
jgi:hypothetical protein